MMMMLMDDDVAPAQGPWKRRTVFSAFHLEGELLGVRASKKCPKRVPVRFKRKKPPGKE